MGEDIACKWEPKRAGVATPAPDRVDAKSKMATGHKEGYSIMIKRSILQEETIIIKIRAPNSRAPNYMTQN